MKKISLFSILAASLCGAPAYSQVTIDNFESGIGTWTATPTSYLAAPLAVNTDGGANSTPNYLFIHDAGFGFNITGPDLVSPPAGNYRLTYYHKNGFDLSPMGPINVVLLQGGSAKSTRVIPATATDWTFYQSAPFELTGAPVSINIYGSTPAAAGYKAGFDQFILEPLATLPLDFTVTPDDDVYISQNRTIKVNPTGGTGPYTVSFNVSDDGTTEATDSTAPFEFQWNTLLAMPQDTSGTVTLRVHVSDAASGSASTLLEYTVDNQFNGRVTLLNETFSNFTDNVSNITTNVPVGWFLMPDHVAATAPEYGPAASYSPEAGNALRIKSTANADGSLRFPLRSAAFAGNHRDLQTTFWGKGDFCRLYYLTSTDNGATFVMSYQDAGQANSNIWTYVVEPAVQNALGLQADGSQVAIGPHVYGGNDLFWDDITLEGNLVPASSDVEGWNFY